MNLIFALQSESDGTPLTGQASSTTVYISQDGGSYAATTNSVVEIGRGSYKVELTSAEATFSDVLIYQPVCVGAQTNTWAIDAPIDISGLATSSDLSAVASNVSTIKSKTDNLPESPAAVGSAMALTEATVTSIRNGLATITATDALAQGLDNLASYGDLHWSTADLSGVSTFDPATDAVTLTDAYDAAKTASQLTTSDLSALATSAEINALASVANDTLAGMLYWRVVDDTLITYGSNGSIRGQYTITKDSTGNIVKIEPIPSNDGN